MSKLNPLFINISVAACTSLITTFLVLFVFSTSGTNASSQQPATAGAELLASAQQTVSGATPQTGIPESLLQKCQGDIDKFCAKKDSMDEKTECLQDHFDQVSKACHNQIQANRDKNFAPCKDDIAHFCAQVNYGGGRMMNCLRAAGAKLSKGCAPTVGRR